MLICQFAVDATHLIGGYIYAERVSQNSFLYEINVEGVTEVGDDVLFGGGTLRVGSIEYRDFEVLEVTRTDERNMSVSVNQIKIQHQFASPGFYTISYSEENRGTNISNVINSSETPFYIETKLSIDPAIGSVSTPILVDLPGLLGEIGKTYYSALQSFTSDSRDSLAVKTTVPLTAADSRLGNYLFPNNPDFYTNFSSGNQDENGSPRFLADEISGTVIWDAPGAVGQYLIALDISQFRVIDGTDFLISTTSLEYVVSVLGSDNLPKIILESETCVSSQNTVSINISSALPYSVQPVGNTSIATINGVLFEAAEFENLSDDRSYDIQFESENSSDVLLIEVANTSGIQTLGFIISDDCPVKVVTGMPRQPEIQVYPNPASTYLEISGTSNFSEAVLTDLLGRNVLQFFNREQKQFDISHLNPGTYFLLLKVDGSILREKVVIQ